MKQGKAKTQFKSGKSGNPNGRPKSALNSLLQKLGNEKVNGKTREELLAEKIWAMGLKGDREMVKLLVSKFAPEDVVGKIPVKFTLSIAQT